MGHQNLSFNGYVLVVFLPPFFFSSGVNGALLLTVAPVVSLPPRSHSECHLPPPFQRGLTPRTVLEDHRSRTSINGFCRRRTFLSSPPVFPSFSVFSPPVLTSAISRFASPNFFPLPRTTLRFSPNSITPPVAVLLFSRKTYPSPTLPLQYIIFLLYPSLFSGKISRQGCPFPFFPLVFFLDVEAGSGGVAYMSGL